MWQVKNHVIVNFGHVMPLSSCQLFNIKIINKCTLVNRPNGHNQPVSRSFGDKSFWWQCQNSVTYWWQFCHIKRKKFQIFAANVTISNKFILKIPAEKISMRKNEFSSRWLIHHVSQNILGTFLWTYTRRDSMISAFLVRPTASGLGLFDIDRV